MAYPILKPNSTWFAPSVSTIKRNTITTINIVDTYTPGDATAVVDSWDASVTQDGSIMCYVEGTSLTMAGNGSGKIAANEDSSYMFYDSNKKDSFSALAELNGLNLIDTTNVGYINIDNNEDVEEAKENILPTVSNADNGKILAVVNGIWTAVSLINSEEVSY